MTHVVTESCIRCKYTDCVDVCPVDCFREGPNFLTIDPDECIDCAVCIPECPVNAIYGAGTMLVSAEGRARFGEWPDVIADDYFLDGLFAAGEKRRVTDVEVTVQLPRRFWTCVSRKARVHQGKRDVLAAGLRVHPEDRSGAGSSLLGVVRSRPVLALDLPAHVTVTVAARALGAWRRRRRTAHTFYRDVSSRHT